MGDERKVECKSKMSARWITKGTELGDAGQGWVWFTLPFVELQHGACECRSGDKEYVWRKVFGKVDQSISSKL